MNILLSEYTLFLSHEKFSKRIDHMTQNLKKTYKNDERK